MHHSGFGIDIKDKDTTRYGDAGATVVSYIAFEASGLIYKLPNQRDRIFRLVEDKVDFIILEGFMNTKFIPRVALIKELNDLNNFIDRDTVGISSHLIDLHDHDLYIKPESIPEMVEKLAYPKIPNLNCKKCGFDSCAIFYENFLKRKVKLENCVTQANRDIVIRVNDKFVPLNKFASKMVKNIIKSCIESLTIPTATFKNIQINIEM